MPCLWQAAGRMPSARRRSSWPAGRERAARPPPAPDRRLRRVARSDRDGRRPGRPVPQLRSSSRGPRRSSTSFTLASSASSSPLASSTTGASPAAFNPTSTSANDARARALASRTIGKAVAALARPVMVPGAAVTKSRRISPLLNPTLSRVAVVLSAAQRAEHDGAVHKSPDQSPQMQVGQERKHPIYVRLEPQIEHDALGRGALSRDFALFSATSAELPASAARSITSTPSIVRTGPAEGRGVDLRLVPRADAGVRLWRHGSADHPEPTACR